jgi:hypothetical protein
LLAPNDRRDTVLQPVFSLFVPTFILATDYRIHDHFTNTTNYSRKMMSLKSILSFFLLLVCLVTSSSAAKKEEEESALQDLQIGMTGLKEAADNPVLLAQLMRDLAVSRLTRSPTGSD